MGEYNGFMPEFELFPRIERAVRAARAVGHAIFHMPGLLASHGEHFVREPRGASEQLDAELYDKFRGSEDMNRWCDQGTYYEDL